MGKFVQCTGKKGSAKAFASCKQGTGNLLINNSPVDLIEPESMRFKIYEPLILVGTEKLIGLDITVTTRGGGNQSQIYGTILIELFGKRLQRV